MRDVDEGDYVSAESHVTCGVCFHCRTGQGAHVRADADPRRRSRRRVRRLRRGAGVRRLAQRPREASARDRVPAGAVRQRRLRDLDAGPRGTRGRRPRLRAGRALHDRDREGVRRRAGSSPPTTSRSGWSSRAQLGADDVVERRRGRRRARVVRRAQRGHRRRRRLRDVGRAEGDRGRVRDRAARRQRRPLRDPGAPGDDRHRRVAHLQEPHGHAR